MNNGDPPPPAYSEQEFDQKISTALSVSLTVSRTPAVQTPAGEVWEEWNEAEFEAAACMIPTKHHQNPSWPNQTGAGSEGHSAEILTPASTEPLRIHKKSASRGKLGIKKSYLDGYQEGVSDRVLTCPPQSNLRTEISPQSGARQRIPRTNQPIHHDIPPVEESDFSLPPPPFSCAELNPDGTPIVIMSYNPSISPPPSPLVIPPISVSPLPDHLGQFPRVQTQLSHPRQTNTLHERSVPCNRPPRQSLPAQPQSFNNQLGKRPVTSLGPRSMQASGIPRMDFDPLVAYNKQGSPASSLTRTEYTQPHVQSFSANAFYNSAVSAHFPNSHTTPTVNGLIIDRQPPQTLYHSSGYDPNIGQTRQTGFYESQHMPYSVRGGPVGVNHK